MLLSITAGIDLSAYAKEDGYVYGSNTLTRAEWMHDLSLAFSMEDESGYLENYYNDLDATHKYYEDILLNNKYGTIDLEAGSNFYPDNEVTREFAVHTINSLLGYQKQSDYVFSDVSLCNYPDDAQVAVELGWLELNAQNFSPDSYLNSLEAKTMIEFALNVNAESIVDENYDSNWDVASDVIEIPNGTQVTTADNIITIYDSPKTIKSGDAVYYSCIFNFINKSDFVPNVPLKIWGFKRYGYDIFFDETTYKIINNGIKLNRNNFNTTYKKHTDIDYSGLSLDTNNDILKKFENVAPTYEKYYNGYLIMNGNTIIGKTMPREWFESLMGLMADDAWNFSKLLYLDIADPTGKLTSLSTILVANQSKIGNTHSSEAYYSWIKEYARAVENS